MKHKKERREEEREMKKMNRDIEGLFCALHQLLYEIV